MGSENQDGLICSQRSQKGVYLCRMNTTVLQLINGSAPCALQHQCAAEQPLPPGVQERVWYRLGIVPCTFPLDSVETSLMTHEECSIIADFSGFRTIVKAHPAGSGVRTSSWAFAALSAPLSSRKGVKNDVLGC